MYQKILRSVIAIVVGAIATVGSSVIIMTTINAFCSIPFRPDSEYSVGWLLIFLASSSVSSIIGGFVTGVVARRSEIKHAIGLVLFAFLISLCFSGGYKSTTHFPDWYMVALVTSWVPSILLGAWLRMRQGALLWMLPAGATQAANSLWLSVAISVDHFRFPVAIGVSVITFFVGLRLAILLGGLCLLGIQRLLGQDQLLSQVAFIWVVASFVLSFVLARYVFRRIMAVDTSLLKGAQ